MLTSAISKELNYALTEYACAAANVLQAEVTAGAEVELELGSQLSRSGAQTLFYSCTPMTGRFIAERMVLLEGLPEHGAAVTALAKLDGIDRYLAGRSSPEIRARAGVVGRDEDLPKERARACARAAALRLLEDVFAEQTELELRPDRLSAALARLECAVSATAPDTVTLIATLHGLTIASQEIKLTKGLAISMPEALGWAPEQALVATGEPTQTAGPGHLLVALTCAHDVAYGRDSHEASGTQPSVADRQEAMLAGGREILKDLLRALRLFGDGRVTFGPLAWWRAGGQDAWSAFALGAAGRPHGMLVVSPEQEDELRAFCNLVSRRSPADDELAWALRRFELGCEREHPYEALSDHLLALRALLEPEGPSSGLLAGRVAALCATPLDRPKLTERMTKAQRLEQAFVAGAATERAAGVALVRDVADHLRALLRDVICGHLAPDLTRLADELLAAPDVAESNGAESDGERWSGDQRRSSERRPDGQRRSGERRAGGQRRSGAAHDVVPAAQQVLVEA